VFKVKRHADGSVQKYKVRLVACGSKQTCGFDYTETFAPVFMFVTLQMVIALTIILGWPIELLEVVTAFVYGLTWWKEPRSPASRTAWLGIASIIACNCYRRHMGSSKNLESGTKRLTKSVCSTSFEVLRFDPCL
jgi:hypothetical protein